MSVAPTQRTKAVFGTALLSMLKAAATAATRPGGTFRECPACAPEADDLDDEWDDDRDSWSDDDDD